MLLTKLEQQIDPRHTALLVIDMQNDFVSGRGKFAAVGLDMKMIQAAVPVMNNVIEEARRAGVMIMWVNTTHSLRDALPNYIVGNVARVSGRPLKESDFIVQEGSWGAEYYSGMTQRCESDFECIKHTYCGFTNTKLDTYLKAKEIKTIVNIGATTNVCVRSTAMQGFFLGYYSVILSDAAASNDAFLHEATIRNFSTFIGYTAKSEEVIAIWKRYAGLAASQNA